MNEEDVKVSGSESVGMGGEERRGCGWSSLLKEMGEGVKGR